MASEKTVRRRTYMKEWYKRNKKRQAKLRRAWWAKNKHKYRAQRIAHGKQYRDQVRKDTFCAYGGKCTCCGETNWVFLTIDHIYDDGYKERGHRRVGGSATYVRLRSLGYPKDRFQLLCMNCNWAKRYGECPHKTLPQSKIIRLKCGVRAKA